MGKPERGQEGQKTESRGQMSEDKEQTVFNFQFSIFSLQPKYLSSYKHDGYNPNIGTIGLY
jgi:hypothetical protein